tara:strand:+ start:65 stop:979 length:915 start_codon:yes stop_codon:yes gene_type:complete
MNNNDHYVPQFLLRRFCNDDGRLHVFDKWNDRSFVSSTRNVASEKGFYDVKLDDEIVSFEPLLSTFENAALEALNAVVENNSLAVLSDADRVNVAYFLAIQTLRTRAQREMLAQMDQGMRDTLPFKGVAPEDLPDDFYRNGEQLKADSVLHLPMAEEFVPHFLAKDWCLNAPPAGATFFVSDHPVVRRNIHPPPSFMGNNGIASEGIQIYLPLSADLILCMLCPTLITPFREQQKELTEPIPILTAIDTGRAFVIPAECVTYCNSLQVAYSERFVFSCNDDFSLAKGMLSTNPELRKPSHVVVQ